MPKGDYARMHLNLLMPRPLMFQVPFILLIFCSLNTGAQQFIGKNKSSIINEYNRPGHNRIIAKDSFLVLTYTVTEAGTVDKLLSFNEADSCIAEKYVSSSPNTYKLLLDSIIAQKKFEWRKINENQYVSKFSDRLMIELPVKKDDNSFTVFHAEWTRELYNMLTGK
jgi:hypothetical protein